MSANQEPDQTWDESRISQVRESLASFCEEIGSPSHHQDATMDNSYSVGFRSPSMSALAGQTSPAQGRSLREYEEQMSALRKENFNLKLRIYFLEENAGFGGSGGASSAANSIPGSHGSSAAALDGAPENLFKQNIDLKVEVESLRKDLQEKQDLLLQAAKAMELMEDGQRKAEEHHREVIDDLEHRLTTLQHEIKQMEAAERQQQANMSRSRLNETGLLDFLDKMEHRDLNMQDKNPSMELDNVVRQCHEQNEELCRRIGDLHKQLEEKELKIGAMEAEMNELRYECAEMRDKLEENEKSSSDAEIVRLKQHLFEVRAELADKLCLLDETECKLKDKTTEHIKAVKMVEKFLRTLQEQEKEIARLKRNSIVSDSGTNVNHPAALPIVDQDLQPVTQDQYDELHQRLKATQKKNDSLISKLTGGNSHDRNENIIIKQLNEELIQAREETEKAQRWHRECVDLCAISTARLEELAGFLDSLLKNKEFSGSLPSDRRRAMRKAVERSLDLSKSLNMSISVTGFSLPENSLTNLSSLSGYLDAEGNSLLADCDTNKENEQSVGGSAAKVIECLKAENRELRGQLEGRRKSHVGDARRRLVPVLAEPPSDSEAWSEPDRDVSQARIGLEERSSLTNSAGKVKSNTAVRGLGGILQELSSTSENDNVGLSRKQVSELKHLQESIESLTIALQDKDNRILEAQSRSVDLDNKLQEERMKATRMQAELENTRHVNQRLEKENSNQLGRTRDYEKRLGELSVEIQQKDDLVEKLKKDREQAFVDLRVAVMKLENLRAEYQESQQKHKTQTEHLLAQEHERLEALRHDLTESFNSQLKAKQASFDASLTESYISKNIYSEKIKELEELHFRLEDAHENMASMSEDENRLKTKLAELEATIHKLSKSLDVSILQGSKAAIERSQALKEKYSLEEELNQYRRDLESIKAEKNELNVKLIEAQALVQQNQHAVVKRLNSSSGAEGSNASGYTSEELLVVKPVTGGLRQENSSPDLGIESDAGRISNSENQRRGAGDYGMSPARPLLKTLELTKSMSNLLTEPTEGANQNSNSSATGDQLVHHDCAKIEADCVELKRRLKNTKRLLEMAHDTIKSANKRKERLEQDIKQQIQKTNVVLKTVRTNMTNELEKSPSGSALPAPPRTS